MVHYIRTGDVVTPIGVHVSRDRAKKVALRWDQLLPSFETQEMHEDWLLHLAAQRALHEGGCPEGGCDGHHWPATASRTRLIAAGLLRPEGKKWRKRATQSEHPIPGTVQP